MNRLWVLGIAGLLTAQGWVTADPPVPVEPPRNPYAADEWKLPAAQPSVKAGPGAGLVIANCAQCHSLDYITTQPPLTRAQWTAGIEKMRGRFGATTPTNLVPNLADYLTSAYGKP